MKKHIVKALVTIKKGKSKIIKGKKYQVKYVAYSWKNAYLLKWKPRALFYDENFIDVR